MIRQVEITVPMAELGREGLPALYVQQPPDLSDADRVLLGEQEGRSLAGRPASALPYRHQNHYGRELTMRTLPAIEVSNSHLVAIFLPSLGGRLWSLEDVSTGQQLLFQPDGIQFGNLALRDAWFSGGVEWNLGMTGHWGLTAAPVAAGVVDVDAVEVLRMWAWERLTRMVWRMDVWLPEESTYLFTSPLITNPREEPTPLYWWSNAAVPIRNGSRVLAPAETAVFNNYDGKLERALYPDTPDRSMPSTAAHAVDYFFDTAAATGVPHPTPWVAGVSDDAAGVLIASSSELRGKKLFVWGNTRGGGKWQDWLNGTGRYYELQSGWARTQKEHIALPGGDTASWVEAYGAAAVQLSGHYGRDRDAVADLVPRKAMEEAGEMFVAARNRPPTTVFCQPEGWGRVEVEAGFLPHDAAAPFSTAPLTAEQTAWLDVAAGAMPSTLLDRSPQSGAQWRQVVERCGPGVGRFLHLGYMAWADGERARAEELWREALEMDHGNAMALHCLSLCVVDPETALGFAARAHQAGSRDADLLVEYVRRGRDSPALVHQVIEESPTVFRELPPVRIAAARALVAQGRLTEAGEMIDSLVVPNLRESSTELADLWTEFCAAAGTDDPLPEHLDFSMS